MWRKWQSEVGLGKAGGFFEQLHLAEGFLVNGVGEEFSVLVKEAGNLIGLEGWMFLQLGGQLAEADNGGASEGGVDHVGSGDGGHGGPPGNESASREMSCRTFSVLTLRERRLAKLVTFGKNIRCFLREAWRDVK